LNTLQMTSAADGTIPSLPGVLILRACMRFMLGNTSLALVYVELGFS